METQQKVVRTVLCGCDTAAELEETLRIVSDPLARWYIFGDTVTFFQPVMAKGIS